MNAILRSARHSTPTSVAGRSTMFSRVIALVAVFQCLLLAVAAAADSSRTKVDRVGLKCREENYLKKEEVENLRNSKQSETTDERIKCFLKCMLKGLRLMNEAGELTVEGDSAYTKKYKKQYLACKDVGGSDACDKALNFHKCVWRGKGVEEGSFY